MENKAFRDRSSWSYNMFKPRMASLTPKGPHAVLDLGCGTSVPGRKLEELNKPRQPVALEMLRIWGLYTSH